MPITGTRAALGLSAVLLATACGSGGKAADESPGGTPAITVDATDSACTLSKTTTSTGTIGFVITNKGSKVTEFYVYGPGDQIVAEKENIGPGLSQKLAVEISKPGTYITACKPGMQGDGIRGELKVTGKSTAANAANPALATATASYKSYVDGQADLLLHRTSTFVAAVKAGDVVKAKQLYPQAREPWERIEPVAESFGALDLRIDGRADVVDQGMEFTGYHRLEKDLWKDGLHQDSGAIADQLLADVKEVTTRATKLTYNPLQLANGSKALLDEMATGKVTGEEERYSHTDLYDFSGNFDGAKTALALLSPVIQKHDPALAKSLADKQETLAALIAKHRHGGAFDSYTSLSKTEVKQLSDALDAYSGQVARVAGVIAQA